MSEIILDASEKHLNLETPIPDNLPEPTKDVAKSILEPMEIKPLKLPQFQIDRMYASYDEICVRDFGDMYHMSEDERRTASRFYDAFKSVRRVKNRHKKLPEYIKACRIVLKCLSTVAEENGVYPPDKFKSMVLKGKIKVNGLKIPRYTGKGKKDINWSLVADYILDDTLDPYDLVATSPSEYWEVRDEDDIESLAKYLGKDVMEYITEVADSGYVNLELFDIDDDDPSGLNVVTPYTKKQQKRLLKHNKQLVMGIKELRRLQRSSRDIWSQHYAFDVGEDAFQVVKDIDNERDMKPNKIPEFQGSIFNKEEFDDYMATLEQFERDNVKIERNSKYYSMDDIDEMDLKASLEDGGVDVRKLVYYKQQRKADKIKLKRDKKRIKDLKNRLTKMEGRYKKRKGEEPINTKKKKNKKKKKGEKNHDYTPQGYKNFDEYQSSMESWDD